MKKHIRIIAFPIFTTLYALFLGFGLACLLRLLSVSVALSLDADIVRSIPFYFVVGLFALIALIGIVILNIKCSEKLKYTEVFWIIQSICAFALSLPVAANCDELFVFLQEVF